MCETYKEHRPLLCDELSEEEQYGPEYPRRGRQVYGGWARNNVKGAASIITRWPDHCSTSLAYWWIVLSMIAVTIFVIYNAVLALALLHPTPHRAHKQRVIDKVDSHSNINSTLPEVYMHIFANSGDKIDTNNFLPYIEIMSEKYPNFKYNLIIVLNDTAEDNHLFSMEENNEIAFNSIWTTKHKYEKLRSNKHNIKVRHISLSNYLGQSPISKIWRLVPHQFIEFLVRAISVWDKGGIAINPIILTPRSPHDIYVEKFQTILENYARPNKTKYKKSKIKESQNKAKEPFKKKVNNIRDIIEILEHEDDVLSSSSENLTEAEDKKTIFVTRTERKLRSITSKSKNDQVPESIRSVHTKMHLDDINETEQSKGKHNEHIGKVHDLLQSSRTNNDENHNLLHFQPIESNDDLKFNMLPFFLEFLFHDKPKINLHKEHTGRLIPNATRHRKSILPIDNLKQNITMAALQIGEDNNKNEARDITNYKPMIISAKATDVDIVDQPKKEIIETAFKHDNSYELTIDLKGNIIATKTACHAFIGTLFNGIVHITSEETLKDFIIAELSYFCKGLLSSCRGIDIILL